MNQAPLKYVILVFVLSVPFWILGAFSGKLAAMLPIDLPLSALMFICPLGAAVILVRLENGPGQMRPFLARAFDFRRIRNRLWYLPALGLMPAGMLLSYGLMTLFGRPLPSDPSIPWIELPIFFVLFFIGAIGEELGWTAYLTDRLQGRWSALRTGLVIGLIWAVWHIIPFYQARPDLAWVLWQSAVTVALRVIIVWLYNNTNHSVFMAILFHTMINVSNFAFPNYGSHYDPLISLLVLAAIAILIILLWGGQTLARFRFAPGSAAT